MNSSNRPLSPHMQVYRPQLTTAMSIFHRITGVGAAIGLLLLVFWFLASSGSAEQFENNRGIFNSWIGWFGLFVWSVAMYYHVCNGVRHLMWDSGHGYDIPTVYTSGYVVLIATAVLTVFTWAALIIGGVN